MTATSDHRAFNEGALTTDQGIPVADTDNSLRAGPAGPSLLEDFHLREKLMRFDHERIPERVVHARGAGAHGVFKVYEPLRRVHDRGLPHRPGRRDARSSCGSPPCRARAAPPTPRATCAASPRSSTPGEGNFDLVGNNMPVFFIQDGIKFPDLVHALKPEPHHEMPQAASAHDTFWDFVHAAARDDAPRSCG